MRKLTFLKTMLLAIVMTMGSGSASAQLLVEDFSYAIGTVLTTSVTADATTGWAAQSAGNGTANIDVTTGLNFTNYLSGGVGGAANADATGQDIFKPFTSQTSGILYTAFLVNITANTTAGYFFHLGPNPIGTTFFSRVWVNASGNVIGLTNTSTAPTSYVSVATGVRPQISYNLMRTFANRDRLSTAYIKHNLGRMREAWLKYGIVKPAK